MQRIMQYLSFKFFQVCVYFNRILGAFLGAFQEG